MIKKILKKLIPSSTRQEIRYRLIGGFHGISACLNPRSGVTKTKRSPELVVSLTTIPERIDKVHLCLDSLLCQSVKPDRIILWLGADGGNPVPPAVLPNAVGKLQKRGLEIRWCEDMRSYKKIIPTMQYHPDALIVTADDDVFYPRRWLRELYQAYQKEPQYIHCHRAHLIKYDEAGEPVPYQQWDLLAPGFQGPSSDLFPTGVGGVLYAPGHLHQEVLNKASFLMLCPSADDVWLKAMSLLNQVECKKIRTDTLYTPPIRISNNRELWVDNVTQGGNDAQIRAVSKKYGIFVRRPIERRDSLAIAK